MTRRGRQMGVTSSSTETIFTSIFPEEPDHAEPISNAELAEALHSRTREIAVDERVEIDVTADDQFGI